MARRIAWNTNTEGYTVIGFGTETLPGPAGGGTLTVTSSLYINGVARLPIADISGHSIHRDPSQATGDSAGTLPGLADDDIFWMGPGVVNTALIWDERATSFSGGFRDLYHVGGNPDVNFRYGLPGGQPGQRVESIEVIRGGDQDLAGSSSDSFAHDFINLSYNSVNGGVAYNLDITIDVGAGRDLVVSGEGNDVIYGGDENLGLGDGLLGMGGNDTIYGGMNISTHSTNGTRGADDLFGYSGNDTLYGFNDGDVYYGDAGDDVIFMPGSALTNDVLGLFAHTTTGAQAVGQFSTATAFGGDGADTIVASRLNDADASDGVHERFFGGNVPSTWYDKEYFDSVTGANGADTSLDDTISYAFANTGVNVNIAATQNEIFQDPDNGNNSTLSYGVGGNITVGGVTVASASSGDRYFGIEHVVGTNFADIIRGNEKANRLFGGAQNDTLFGEAASDTLIGGLGDDTLDAGADNDFLQGEAGADSLIGGSGIDTLSYQGSAAVTVFMNGALSTGGDAQGDHIGSDIEVLIGSANNDFLTGSGVADTIYGGGGVDTINGGVGADSLIGDGDDWLSYAGGVTGVTINLNTATQSGGEAQNDVVSGFIHVLGSAGNDSLRGTAGANSLVGGQGDDTIEGGVGADFLDGGAGTGDYLSYANSGVGVRVTLSGNTVSNGDAAGDTIQNFEHLIGSGAGDGLTGDSGVNTIFGGGGVDTVDGLGGNDSLFGGGQGDYLNYGNAGSGVVVNLTTSISSGGLGNDTFTGFQHILGSLSDDILTGDGLANSLMGSDGRDTLSGLGGIDTLDGGEGNDTLVAGVSDALTGANTTIVGWDGASNTTVVVSSGANVVSDRAFGGNGIDTFDIQNGNRNILSPLGAGTMLGVEIIVAGAAADVINLTFNSAGLATAVTVYAGAGDDLVFSGAGADLIVGGRNDAIISAAEGSDTLYGGLGNDTIFGDDNNSRAFGAADTLYGGSGTDLMDGGLGNDTIYGGDDQDNIEGWTGDDVVFDGNGDQIFGGLGNDLLVLQSKSEDNSEAQLFGGADNDRVFVTGDYAKLASDLGPGNDLFISLAVSGLDLDVGRTDNVRGGTGGDVISAWYGNDILYGDDSVSGGGGSDVIWGGAGVDTIYGGDDSDLLYGGAGDGDLLVGGGAIDTYYWARQDGDDTIEDRDNDSISGDEGDNYILVFAGFAFDAADPDGFINGAGVFETDGNLYDNDGNDMVQLVVDGTDNTIYHLTVLNGQGAGSTLTFDRDEISLVALGNSDNGTVAYYWWVDDPMNPLGGSYQLV